MNSAEWHPEIVPSLAGRKCLVATDVPFWKQANGSHARIRELLRALHHAGIIVRVWYIGDSRSARQIAPREIPFVQWNWCERVTDRWAHWLPRRHARHRVAPNHAGTSRQSDGDPIAHFVDPAITRRFLAEVRRYQPDLVLCEYLSLAALFDAITASTIPTQRQPLKLIDTHDVLSQRHAESTRTGLVSWLPVSAENELRWVAKFDLALAIRDADAHFFRKALPAERVIVVGHPALQSPKASVVAEECRFGILAGAGEPNLRGVHWLLESIWPAVVAAMPEATLTIAGNLGARLKATPSYGSELIEHIRAQINTAQRVQVCGTVERLEDFYQGIDVGLNPVDIDSGLKIKSIETIGFGRPLITHLAGSIASQVPRGVQHLATTPQEFIEAMLSFREKQVRLATATQAARYAEQHLSPRAVYRDLLETLASRFQ